jgi:cell wall-associated NlpC family hydrolase
VNERGQISIAACGLLVLLVLAGALIGYLGGIDQSGAGVQRAADMAALAAGRVLADDPNASLATLRAAAADAADGNGARLVEIRTVGGVLPEAIEVRVASRADGAAGEVEAVARAAVSYSATLPDAGFRPVDLHGAGGRAAVIAAAAAQVGWPYVWGGESRAEGGFDCSGLVDYAFQAAGVPLPGRPTAAALWSMAQPESPSDLEPGDLVFLGAPTGAPYHVGIYVGEGTVLSAPHTGARVGYSPLAAGGWDGFGRLLPAEPGLLADPVQRAARSAGVPAHVIAAELSLGLAADAGSAAEALAAAMRTHPSSLEAALAAQVGDPSRAALVLRWASGPDLPVSSTVRLVPVPAAAGDTSGSPRIPAGPAAAARGRRSPAGGWLLNHLGTALDAGERAAEQLGERGRAVPLQAVGAIEHLSRFGLTALGTVLPDPDWRDAANLAGSAWDAATASADLVRTAGTAGLELGGVALWAARLSAVGGALSAGLFGVQAWRARRTRDRIGYGLMAAGSIATTAGLATAGGSLIALGTGASVIPPVGLALMAAGAGLCVGGYLVRHPEWCRQALRAGGAALDLAWRVQSAPVRAAASVGGAVADGVRSIASSIPTPW